MKSVQAGPHTVQPAGCDARRTPGPSPASERKAGGAGRVNAVQREAVVQYMHKGGRILSIPRLPYSSLAQSEARPGGIPFQ